MTHALRTRHRRTVAALAALLPIGVGVALWARPATPLAPGDSLAAERDATPLAVAWQGSTGDGSLRVAARLGRPAGAPSHAGAPRVEVAVESGVGEPELLAYWSPVAAADEALPAASVLLGPAAPHATRRFALPEQARAGGGSLILYSLAQGRVAATLALPAASAAGGDDGGAR